MIFILSADIKCLLLSEIQTPVRSREQHISPGSSNIVTWSYHKMDIASLSGAVYGVGPACLPCMGLFWAGLSLSLDSIYHSLATSHCRIQALPPPSRNALATHSATDKHRALSPWQPPPDTGPRWVVQFGRTNSRYLYNNTPTRVSQLELITTELKLIQQLLCGQARRR